MNYTFIITEAELATLSEALGELPFKKSAALVSNLQKQLNEQVQAKVEVPSAESA